jgi:hypothetical protein
MVNFEALRMNDIEQNHIPVNKNRLKLLLVDMYMYGRDDDIRIMIGLRQNEKIDFGIIDDMIEKTIAEEK